jgi:hypothetical protein
MSIKERLKLEHAITDSRARAMIDGIAIGILIACAAISLGCGWL